MCLCHWLIAVCCLFFALPANFHFVFCCLLVVVCFVFCLFVPPANCRFVVLFLFSYSQDLKFICNMGMFSLSSCLKLLSLFFLRFAATACCHWLLALPVDSCFVVFVLLLGFFMLVPPACCCLLFILLFIVRAACSFSFYVLPPAGCCVVVILFVLLLRGILA